MTASNFERSLAVTLQQEGGFSNDAADHGGRTMRGITQREYNAWRRRKGEPDADVKSISEKEIRDIYKNSYWLPCGCDALPPGLDLCVFDYGVNSGPSRAIRELQTVLGLPQTGKLAAADAAAILDHRNISELVDAYCDARAAFLRRIGHGSQSVFLRGWLSRVSTIRHEAHGIQGLQLAGVPAAPAPSLSMGSTGEDVKTLQTKLRALGYPAGLVDGNYGPATRRAVILFQEQEKLDGTSGEWAPEDWAVLDAAKPILEDRAGATAADLDKAGDTQIARLRWIRPILTFAGLGCLAGGNGDELKSFPETMSAVQGAIQPIEDVLAWAGHNWWLLGLLGIAAIAAIVELCIREHLVAFRTGAYQGPAK